MKYQMYHPPPPHKKKTLYAQIYESNLQAELAKRKKKKVIILIHRWELQQSGGPAQLSNSLIK
jgi:hypothetical protein